MFLALQFWLWFLTLPFSHGLTLTIYWEWCCFTSHRMVACPCHSVNGLIRDRSGKILFSIFTLAPLMIGQHLSRDLNSDLLLVHVSETLCIKPELSPISHQKSTWLRGGCCQHLCSLQLPRPTACIQPLPSLSGCSVDLQGLEMRELSTLGSSLPLNQWALTTMRTILL